MTTTHPDDRPPDDSPPGATPLESTSALLDRARAGDASARDRLFERALPALRQWAHRRLPAHARDLLDTEDLVQVALVRAFNHLDEFEARGRGAFLAYLRQILMNAIRDEVRRTTRRPARENEAPEIPDPRPSPLESAVGRETIERYESGLAELSPVQQEAVIMRIELDLSYQEIAEALALPSAEAARKTIGRALVKIAEGFGERN